MKFDRIKAPEKSVCINIFLNKAKPINSIRVIEWAERKKGKLQKP